VGIDLLPGKRNVSVVGSSLSGPSVVIFVKTVWNKICGKCSYLN
jgi:hypothetical protein